MGILDNFEAAWDDSDLELQIQNPHILEETHKENKLKILPGYSGKAKIEHKNNMYVLYVDEMKWMISGEDMDMARKEFYSSYDLASGNVLLSGLGFGILVQWLSEKPEVTSITVIEQSQDVVDMFLENNQLDPKVKVYISDIKDYTDNEHYDWAILDHYEEERKPTKIELDKICSNLQIDNLWFWSIEDMLLKYKSWSNFREDFSMKIPNLPLNQVKKYVIDLTKHKGFELEE